MNTPLQNKTIIDFSYRLPGPLAGKLLLNLGATVIKIEDIKFQDPFIRGFFAKMDHSFPIWYEKLNHKKNILRVDFSNKKDQKKIQKLIVSSDGVIISAPDSIQEKLGITKEHIKAMKTTTAVIYPKASKENKNNMHDLNVLALTGLLKLHTKNCHPDHLVPPFLPIAGINFGQQIALDLLACILKAKNEQCSIFMNSYLLESAEEVYLSFWPKELQEKSEFLHNGLYPCYNIYLTKDNHFVVMACVEEKFWESFCMIFSLHYTSEERFDTSKKIYQELKDYFLKLTKKEISMILKSADICINLI